MLFRVDNDDEVENPCLGALLLPGEVKEVLATDADLSTCCKRIYILPIDLCLMMTLSNASLCSCNLGTPGIHRSHNTPPHTRTAEPDHPTQVPM